MHRHARQALSTTDSDIYRLFVKFLSHLAWTNRKREKKSQNKQRKGHGGEERAQLTSVLADVVEG